MTGRPRRCGWLDLPLLRYSNMINGTEWLVVTKMDVMDECAEIPVCTHYEIDGKMTDRDPGGHSRLQVDQADLHDAEGLELLDRGHHRVRQAAAAGEGLPATSSSRRPARRSA